MASEIVVPATGVALSPSEAAALRLSATDLVRLHFRFVWRLLRRLGLDSASADDATQQVFIVASEKLARIEPGREQAFLYGIALRLAQNHKRSAARTRRVQERMLREPTAEVPRPDEQIDARRAIELVDRALEPLSLELRAVFVMFEIEGLSVPEIARISAIPSGTVASRLRRAREQFSEHINRLRACPRGKR